MGGLNWRIWGQSVLPDPNLLIISPTNQPGSHRKKCLSYIDEKNCDLTYFIIRSTCSLSAFDISHPPLYKANGARRSQNIIARLSVSQIKCWVALSSLVRPSRIGNISTYLATETIHVLKAHDTHYPLTHWPLTHHPHRPTRPTLPYLMKLQWNLKVKIKVKAINIETIKRHPVIKQYLK